MEIIIKDNSTGKQYLIVGKKFDYEIFKMMESGKRKGQWVTMNRYPTSVPSAVAMVLNYCLSDPDDNSAYCVEADKVRVKLGKLIKQRVDQIVLEVTDDQACVKEEQG